MRSLTSSRFIALAVITLVPLLVVFAAGCPFSNTNGSTEPEPGGPAPSDEIEFEITIEGRGTVTKKWDGRFVALTAIPDNHWRFDGWPGTAPASVNPLTIQPTDTTSIKAHFVEIVLRRTRMMTA